MNVNFRALYWLERIGLNGFFLLLLFTVLLSWMFPLYGSDASPLPLGVIIEYGMPLIFFFYGAKLSPEQLKAGLANWKLHVVVQATTFVLFPVIVLLFGFLRNDANLGMLWLGTFYLAALPSTVSSSVVMVSIARGNLAAAIFNASLSSILGIFITPLWVGIFTGKLGGSAEFYNIIFRLCMQVLVPVIVGLLVHRYLAGFVKKYKAQLTYFDQTIILLIVFTAFGESFYNHSFSAYSPLMVVLLGVVMLAFFFMMFGLMNVVSTMLGFSRADRITVLFCGSKKSLVQGALMGGVLLPSTLPLGVVLLPLMLYHALQLMAGSAIARKLAGE